MRRLFFSIFCILPSALFAASTFSLSTVSGHPGDTVLVEASLSDFANVAALQMTVPLSEHLQYVSGSAKLASSQTAHQVAANSSNGKLIVSIYNFAGATLIGSSGEVFSFKLALGNEPNTYSLVPEVLLSNAAGAAIAVTPSSGRVTLLAPKIQITTSQIDYGRVPIRSTYSKTLTIRNSGNEALHITDVEFSAAEFSVSSTAYTINPGNTQQLTINYAPTTRGAISETVKLHSNAVNSADVYGANKAVLKADPYSVNELRMLSTEGVADDTVTVTLTMNNMETDLVGLQVSIVLPEQLQYIENSVVPLTRAAGLTAAAALVNDTLTLFLYSLNNTPIQGEEGNVLSFRLRLNGRNIYQLFLKKTILANAAGENMVSATIGGFIRVQSPKIDGETNLYLGTIPITESYAAHYPIRNLGTAPLTIDKITFLADGFRVLSPLPIVIAPKGYDTLAIEFTPFEEGPFSTTMQIYSNDPENRMKSVTVTASVVEPNVLAIDGEQMTDDTYHIHVSLSNYTPIVGLQMDVHSVPGSAPSFVPSARIANHTCLMRPLGGGKYRILVYSLSNVPIADSTGVIIDIVYPAEDKSNIDKQKISIDKIYLSDINNVQRLTGTSLSHTIKYSYTITWQNEDGSLIDQTTVEYGNVPTHAEPTKQATAEYTYSFAGWSPDVVAVTGDATYTATFTATKNKYLIDFQDEDGTILKSDSVEYGEMPIAPAAPSKPADSEYTYTFAGWTPNVVAVTGNATYTATFVTTRNTYTITWLNEDGSLIDQTTVEYGIIPTHAEPTKAATAEYTYVFSGWSPDVVAVTGDATYTATFTAMKNKYLIVFQDEDGTTLKSDSVEYGEMPIAPAAPSKPADSEYIYTFAGWTPEIAVVTNDATYTATYDATPVSEGVEEISSEDIAPRKVMIDGNVFILRGEKVYTLQGQEVK